MKQQKAHATYGASTAERWINCPGSIQLIKQAPPQVESEFANEGTLAHEVLENYFLGKPNLKKPGYNEEMHLHAKAAWRYINKIGMVNGGQVFSEQKVDAGPFTRPGEFGTLDNAVVVPFETLYVFDYKYGSGIAVEPEENLQLIYYALGLLYKHEFNFSHVELVIIQPRAYHEKGPIRSWRITVDEILKYVPIFKNAVKKCESLDAFELLNPGKWCRFCPAAIICSAVTKDSMKQAAIDFAPTGAVAPSAEKSIATIKDLGILLQSADRLEFWIDEVRKYAYQVLSRGGKVRGYKLVDKRGTRKWIDEEKAASEAKKKFGSKVFKTEFVSPAQLEAITKDKDWVSKRSAMTSSGLTMVPESDARPATSAAQNDFEILPEEKIVAKNKKPGELTPAKTSRKISKGDKNASNERKRKK